MIYNKDMTCEIIASNNIVLVDKEDYEYLSQFRWSINGMGRVGTAIKVNGRYKSFYMHRMILNPPKDKTVDHINHDPLDNRRKNLRVCTHQQNLMNRALFTNNTSGYKGVYVDKRRGHIYAKISVGGKQIMLGRFSRLQDASKAYTEAASEYYGEYAGVAQ